MPGVRDEPTIDCEMICLAEALGQRIADLQRRADESPLRGEGLLAEALGELSRTLAALQGTEQALRRQNEARESVRQAAEAKAKRYQPLFEFAPDAYLVTDTAGVIQEVNYAAATSLNTSREILIGTPLEALMVEAGRQGFRTQLSYWASDPQAEEWQVNVQPPGGVAFPATLTVTCLPGEQGWLVGLGQRLGRVTERAAFQRIPAELESRIETPPADPRASNDVLKLEIAARQQAAVAELGQRALLGSDLGTAMEEAVSFVARTLEVECSAVFEYRPSHNACLLRAGVGWTDGLVGQATVDLEIESQIAGTLGSHAPVVVEDSRFSGLSWLHEQGVVSGMSVAMQSRSGTYGVLGAYTRQRRSFSDADIYFLQAVANVVAAVSERTLAEKELHFQAHLLDIVGQAVIATDLEGTIFYWNRAAEALYGWSATEVVGRNISRVTPAVATRDQAAEIMARLSAGENWSGESLVRRRDGTVFPAMMIDSPIYDDHGELIGIIGISTDITDRKRAEETLRESEARFRAIFERAAIGIGLVDLQGRLMESNPALQEMLDYNAEELRHAVFTEFTHPDDVAADLRLYSEMVAGERDYYQIEKRYVRKDDTFVWGNLTVSLVLDHHGTPQFAVSMIENVTERRQAEQALRETELKLRAIVEHAADAIYIKDCEGRYLLMNPAGAAFVGRAVEEVLGRLDTELFDPEAAREMRAIDRQVMAAGEAYTYEWTRVAGGVERAFFTTAFPYISDQGQLLGIIGISHDITRRKQRERELEAIVAISSALRTVPTLAAMLPVILDQLLGLLAAEGVALVLRDPASGQTTAELTDGEWANGAGGRLAPFEGVTGYVLTTGQPYVSRNIQIDPLMVRPDPTNSLHALACVPLIAQEQTIGALLVGCQSEIAESELRMLTAVADMAANAIRRASLHEETVQLYSQLQSRERFINRIVESMPSSLLVIDRSLRVVSVNRNFLEKARREVRTTLGRKIEDVFPHVLIEYTRLDRKVREVFRTGRLVDGGKLAYRAPGLPTRIYYYRLIPLKADEAVENVMLLMDDITEREQLGEEVRRAERHLASVVECANDLVVSVDPQGGIMTWNRAAERTSGLKAEQVKGRSLISLSAAEQRSVMAEMLQRLVRGEDVQNTEVDLLTATGQEVPISWSCSAMQNDAGSVAGLVAVGRDLTERRWLEAQVIHAAKMASLGVMAGGIAHELRNPLGIISASAQLLLEYPLDTQLHDQCAQKISTATKRASLIIENLLKYAHPLGGQMTEVDLHVVLEETLVLLAHEMSLRQVTLRKELRADRPRVQGNSGLLQQVFTNLILNACNAMPQGGTLRVETQVTKGGLVEIRFCDTGRGIAPEHLPKIFDPFFTTMPVGKGTGLGLSISYSIIQQHQGTIEVESEVGKGTTFTVRLPRARGAGHSKPGPGS
ncbi:MAG: PAS domain S-box protein [Ardenticatenaceae bacterium]|nr:PAS domain S-box protein [Ardenticatenaceae bacterium]HBY95272.1 hypothetical protein [Chloroflexota bacterium]